MISPKRWKTGRMSDLTAFGGRPVSVIDVVEEVVSFSVFWSFEGSVSGVGVIGNSRFHGMDGGIRIGRRERLRPPRVVCEPLALG